jgi:hypothetical protein
MSCNNFLRYTSSATAQVDVHSATAGPSATTLPQLLPAGPQPPVRVKGVADTYPVTVAAHQPISTLGMLSPLLARHQFCCKQ